jgi:hypothetical protein
MIEARVQIAEVLRLALLLELLQLLEGGVDAAELGHSLSLCPLLLREVSVVGGEQRMLRSRAMFTRSG